MISLFSANFIYAANFDTFSFSCDGAVGIEQSDCEALVSIHDNLIGDTYFEEWFSNNAPCTWMGVSCTNGRVTTLAVDQIKSGASIPVEIGDLSMLEYLRINANANLSGSIPNSIGNLTNLVELEISSSSLKNSNLSGPIPSSIGNLTHLTSLTLRYNKLTGSIPASIGNLSSLSGLDVSNNPLSGSLPVELSSSDLNYINYFNTNLCAPNDPVFISWFENVYSFDDRDMVLCGDYTISGTILDSSNNPLADTMIKSDNGNMTISDSNGNYQMAFLTNDNYNIFAELNQFSFLPYSHYLTINDASLNNIDFTGFRITSSVKVVHSNPKYMFNNKAFEVSPSDLYIEFSGDLLNDNSEHSATYLGNWMLIADGKNEIFDTPLISPSICSLPHIPEGDDVLISISNISYKNSVVRLIIDQSELPLSKGSFKLYGCAQASIWDSNLTAINNGENFGIVFSINKLPSSPDTGFSQTENHTLSMPASVEYILYNEMYLNIPAIDISEKIVGVPFEGGEWNIAWLGNDIGYLAGTAFPTLPGNTVLSAHVWSSENLPGVFYNLKSLKYNDTIEITLNGFVYQYSVQSNYYTSESDYDDIFGSKDLDWLTLITCENYDEDNDNYVSRRIIKAVLINVIKNK
jgi:LPXTG-site transpeptidase (sortase) family protein